MRRPEIRPKAPHLSFTIGNKSDYGCRGKKTYTFLTEEELELFEADLRRG